MATNTATTYTVDDPWWVATTDSTVPWITAFPAGTATPVFTPPPSQIWPTVPLPKPAPSMVTIPLDHYTALKKELEEAKARVERLVESLTLLSQGEPVP